MQLSRITLAAVTLAALVCLSGCVSVATPPIDRSVTFTLPPAGASPDYQLGGAYEPAAGVGIVARDRTADPAEGLYSICYINAFQTQPGEQDDWPSDVLLRGEDGTPLIDAGWPDEVILDTSTSESREAIVGVLTPWIRGCADSGFNAVEFDNLDSFTRSGGALSEQNNTALAIELVNVAHGAGLAAAQKNAAELAVSLKQDAGFDFAVAEECAAFDECAAYTDVYGSAVIAVEYADTSSVAFAGVCGDSETPASVVLRDRGLVAPKDSGYVFELC